MEKELQTVAIEVSARHLHLSQADQDILFGIGYGMKIKKDLSQTGQWAAEEKVIVKGPKGEFACRVLGPCRKQTQVELAFSDGYRLGIDVPPRLSGDLKGSAGCMLIGPNGSITLEEGVIDPLRHLHIAPEEAAKRGLQSGDSISIFIDGPQATTFHRVHVRTDPTFRCNIHLDTDEGNACSLPMQGSTGKIVEIIRDGTRIFFE